jgi:hypothetical protein
MSTAHIGSHPVSLAGARLFLGIAVAGLSAFLAVAAAGPLAAQAPATPRVDLPQGWQDRPTSSPTAAQHAKYSDRVTDFELTVRPKMDLAANVDLKAFVEKMRKGTASNSKLANRQETPPVELQVAGRPTIQYDITGEYNGNRYSYRQIFLQCGDNYCMLSCSTTPSHWLAAQPRFDELVARLH